VNSGIFGPDPSAPLTQANSGWWTNFRGHEPFLIPLGSYADLTQSPRGLIDTAGATREWTEEVALFLGQFPAVRFTEGSAWIDSQGGAGAIDG
jgi:hypothetical protein